MKLTCSVCGRERDEEAMTIFSPTTKEKAAMRKMGEEKPLDKYPFCRACIRLLSKPETAIPLMKGIVQFKARSAGVSVQDAEAIAERYGNKVLAVTPKPRS